jgi:hypothetical protein
MAQQPGGPGGPPVGGGAVPDLGALRSGSSVDIPITGERPAVYVNDIQPSVGPDGTVALECRFLSRTGMSEAVVIVLPPGLFLELLSNGGPVLQAALERTQASAKSVGEYLDQIRGTLQTMRQGPVQAERRGGPPVDLSEAREGRDGDAPGPSAG